jgi:glycosyltransferase involved in cell wall biosynthesis
MKSIKDEMESKGLSVVLGSFNRKTFLKLTIESIRQELERAPFPHEIIVIDGGSMDGTLSWLSKQKDILTIIQHNRGKWKGSDILRRSWGYFMNLGFKSAQGKFICMLSDDCLVIPGSIINAYNLFNKMVEEKEQKIGAIAFYWRNWPEKNTYMISSTNHKMLLNHGIFLKGALEEVGFIDEDTFFFYNADADLCLKIWQAGYSIIDSPNSYIEHYAHANISVRAENNEKSRSDHTNFVNKWKDYLEIDTLSTKSLWYWIEKNYVDPNKTIKQFNFLHIFNLRYYLSKCIGWLYRRVMENK